MVYDILLNFVSNYFLPCSHWEPLNPIGHLHETKSLFSDMHDPPFWQRYDPLRMHLSENEMNQINEKIDIDNQKYNRVDQLSENPIFILT